MKLLALTVFVFVALATSKVSSLSHHEHHGHRGQHHSSNTDLNQNQEQDNQQFSRQSNGNQDNINDWTLDDHNQGLNGEYSESNWNVQSGRLIQQNKNIENKQYRQYNNADESQTIRSQTDRFFDQQNSEELYQQHSYNKDNTNNNNNNQNYESSLDFNSGSLELDSQEDYIKAQNDNDFADEIGNKVAQKMVKFFNIVEKYAALNGTVHAIKDQDSLPLRQWALPMAHHHFLNMIDSKVNGLDQGLIKEMYINTERNSIDLAYFFNELLVKGNLKASLGPKGSFNLKMTKTNVNVSTDLQNTNRNRNYAHSTNEQSQLICQDYQDTCNSQSIVENIETKYAQFINRAIESKMVDNTYSGLVGCLRSEIESTFELSSMYNPTAYMTIENKKSHLIVSLARTQSWSDQTVNKQKKIQYVAFRQNKNGNGYKLKVKVVLAKHAQWDSEINAQKGNKQINIKNVNFRAQNIVATAIMERVSQQNGLYKFNVEDAKVKIEGLRYDIGKFDLPENTNQKLAMEIGQNLPKILENGMSAALEKQLYQQQQICQQNSMDCARCNQHY